MAGARVADSVHGDVCTHMAQPSRNSGGDIAGGRGRESQGFSSGGAARRGAAESKRLRIGLSRRICARGWAADCPEPNHGVQLRQGDAEFPTEEIRDGGWDASSAFPVLYPSQAKYRSELVLRAHSQLAGTSSVAATAPPRKQAETAGLQRRRAEGDVTAEWSYVNRQARTTTGTRGRE